MIGHAQPRRLAGWMGKYWGSGDVTGVMFYYVVGQRKEVVTVVSSANALFFGQATGAWNGRREGCQATPVSGGFS